MELNCPTLLLTPDAPLVETLLERAGKSAEYLVHAPHWEAFDRLVSQLVFGVVVVDCALVMDANGESPDTDRVGQVIEEALESTAQARIVFFNIPDDATLQLIREAGAHDVIRSPLSLEELTMRTQRAGETYTWLAQRNYYRGQTGHIFRVEDIVGESPAMQVVFDQVRKVAPSRSPVLIEGETGSGKELIAAAIHYNSPRRDQAIIKVNCAALQDTLLESDLFGHEKGSFTGAVKQRIGRFEQAHGGTLFLDEIGEMSPAIQAKVLRVLQTQEFERVGGTRLIRVNVRIIAATNRVLEEAIRSGSFREDLFYRLNVVTIRLPSLRERPSDISLLAQFFLRKARFEEKRQELEFTDEALAFMQDYNWPGNVRELENTVMQGVLMAEGDRIRREDLAIWRPGPPWGRGERPAERAPVEPERPLPPGDPPTDGAAGEGASPPLDLKAMEKQTILRALEQCAWVQSRAARLLGVSRRALNYKIGKYGIMHPSWRVHR